MPHDLMALLPSSHNRDGGVCGCHGSRPHPPQGLGRGVEHFLHGRHGRGVALDVVMVVVAVGNRNAGFVVWRRKVKDSITYTQQRGSKVK